MARASVQARHEEGKANRLLVLPIRFSLSDVQG